ncbi:class I SAM-dependent methyltransferase [Flavobacterium sp.]|uniref:class I SAM-dependent methyltransferase n=1 Tax=Flavobacterium sp. TaxID=239 RepID=UPI003750C5E0
MKLNLLLKPEIQEYIIKNTGLAISHIAFQKNPFPEIDFKILLNQIEARTKCKEKLSTWYNKKNIIYPIKISVEQTSSEITAQYKSELISGDSVIDLSGGFGVDAYYFSKKVKQVVHCEINQELSEIVYHNFKQLNILNCTCIHGDSTEILTNLYQTFNTIYIDPSRRSDIKGKVFMLKECLPNVVELQDFYYKFSENILIKTAPILDITAGLLELKNVKTIHIVAVDNEVKELLWEINKDYINEITIKTINFNKQTKEVFDFKLSSNSNSNYSLSKKFLYEPNSAIMKSGGFYEIGQRFSLDKLHQHSHLYTSDEIITFPGRIFEIEKVIDYTKIEMKTNLENKKANITTRNFPETVENIRKKWKINDGGNKYCFFTTDINNNKIVLICTKINS